MGKKARFKRKFPPKSFFLSMGQASLVCVLVLMRASLLTKKLLARFLLAFHATVVLMPISCASSRTMTISVAGSMKSINLCFSFSFSFSLRKKKTHKRNTSRVDVGVESRHKHSESQAELCTVMTSWFF
jgi:hypothetical protein